MKKKLVYSFFVSEDTYTLKINDIHFKCLDRFKDVFDCVDITLIVGNRTDNSMDFAYDAETRFLRIFRGKDVSFSIVDNGEFRESAVFKAKVVDMLPDNEMVFFAHNKGVSNVGKYDEKEIYTWVCAMYFYSLNYMKEVEDCLVGHKYYSYGSFLTKNEEPEKCNKYGWYYIGTFFWINSPKLYNYVRLQGIELPKMCDRYYDEEFLGNIISTYPLIMSTSHNGMYLTNCYDFYRCATPYLKMIYDTKADGFDAFYEDMLK